MRPDLTLSSFLLVLGERIHFPKSWDSNRTTAQQQKEKYDRVTSAVGLGNQNACKETKFHG